MSIYRNSIWGLFFLVIGATCSFAQPKSNSPYSRLGLGDIFNQNFAHINGMGDLAASFHDPYTINLLNPASYATLRTTAFEVGIHAKYGNLESNTTNSSEEIWSGNLSYFALGFPLRNPLNDILDRKKRKFDFGMVFALLPYSTVGYNVETDEFLPGADTISFSFEGTGGSYRILWGNAVKWKNLSFGVNLSYLFGKLNNDRLVTFPNLSASYRDELHDEVRVNGLLWNVGFQYDIIFQKQKADGSSEPTGKFLTLGLYGNGPNSFNTRSLSLYRRVNLAYQDLDTLRNTENISGDGQLPAEIALGAIYGKANKWKVGADFQAAFWDGYENDAKEDDLSNTFRFAVGGEYIPDIISYNSYWKRIRYRFGAFAARDPRSDFLNEQLTNVGITLGLGFPIILPRQQKSFLNLALELGRFGSNNELQETYARMTLGFTLNDDTWFFKRKFN
ncbi:MAG: hypothetical protein AAFP19_21670 [Bacteroidota bacterium]